MQLGRGRLGQWDLSERFGEPFSPDGRTVAVLDSSGRLLVLDTNSGRILLRRKVAKKEDYIAEYKWLDPRRLSVLLSSRRALPDAWLPITVR